MLDILIKGGRIVDGSGNPWYNGDVGIAGGKVVDVGTAARDAERVIDAGSRYVSPGFIDIHSHMDLYLLHDPSDSPKVRQGVTTEVLGNCGLAPVPISPKNHDILKFCLEEVLGDFGIPWDWRTIDEYLDRLEPVGVNVCHMVGHMPVRIEVMGGDARTATGPELDEMKGLVRAGMEAGAIGFSSGMTYHPACFSDTFELLELAKVSAEYGGTFAVHQRRWGTGFMASLEEVVYIGREAGVSVDVAHLCPYDACMPEVAIEYVNQARRDGVDIVYDIIPSVDIETLMRDLLPYWVREGEDLEETLERMKDPEVRARIQRDFENETNVPYFFRGWDGIKVGRAVTEKWKEGKSILEIAQKEGKEPIDAFCDLFIQDRLRVGRWFDMNEDEELVTFIKDPNSLIVSDAFLFERGNSQVIHGAFPKVLGKYVRDMKILSVESAVRKLTSFPASKLNLRDRGLILPGMAADIVIFDLERVRDNSTRTKPGAPDGIDYVMVNGELVVEEGELTGSLPGKLLKRR